ncbi:arrestin domain-containing protein 3-like [Thalassophryne amazonica]|uniref:arrestin domain-containing protein 3-like n=1 Tax=Thalassophryne amazonica TaxID=390379 RepID=UPI0014712624|nr:arrestin domain-containing protein 3-like [Thalassophryne amazonica]
MFQQTFKNFHINFNAVNVRNIYTSGDVLSGHVSFDLSKETKITSISLTLSGKASVHWSKGGGGGRRRSRRRNYSAKLKFFEFSFSILQENRQSSETKLLPGTHLYPFSCQLPQGDFPSSFHGVHGHIVYSLTVSISRPWHLSKDFVTEINYVNHINANQPQLWSPLSGSNHMTLCCLWCASGPILLTAQMEKKVFNPGETVKITCKFSNASSRTATPKVTLQQKQIFYTHSRASKRLVVKQLASVVGQPVRPHVSDVHTEITLTVPSTAAFTISNCSILEVDYVIEVNLCVKASPDLTVLFPIILCDTPEYARPPPVL